MLHGISTQLTNLSSLHGNSLVTLWIPWGWSQWGCWSNIAIVPQERQVFSWCSCALRERMGGVCVLRCMHKTTLWAHRLLRGGGGGCCWRWEVQLPLGVGSPQLCYAILQPLAVAQQLNTNHLQPITSQQRWPINLHSYSLILLYLSFFISIFIRALVASFFVFTDDSTSHVSTWEFMSNWASARMVDYGRPSFKLNWYHDKKHH